MYNSKNTKQLIIVDIAQALIDYCSIQPDIDESKVQAAQLVAQNIDLVRLIGKVNIKRCIDPINLEDAPSEKDIELRDLVVLPLCYYTYSRLLKMFAGTMTDGGYRVEEGASNKGAIANTAGEYYSIAESFMVDVLEFLKKEAPQDIKLKEATSKMTPKIRSFGGQERRASN